MNWLFNFWFVFLQLFSPSESTSSNPLSLHLVFCQVVQDTYNEACLRIGREERTKMKQVVTYSLYCVIKLQSFFVWSDARQLWHHAWECHRWASQDCLQEERGRNSENVATLFCPTLSRHCKLNVAKVSRNFNFKTHDGWTGRQTAVGRAVPGRVSLRSPVGPSRRVRSERDAPRRPDLRVSPSFLISFKSLRMARNVAKHRGPGPLSSTGFSRHF